MLAVVRITMAPREEARIAEELQVFPEVRKGHMTDGESDAIVFIEGENPEAIGRFVMEKVRRIRGIESTVVDLVQPFKVQNGKVSV